MTNNNYAQSLLGPQFEAGSAMSYLNKNLPIHVNNQPGGSSTIAGLAIISPRKAHAYIQKGNPPPGSNQQQTLAPFSRSKLGINRSLSVLQPNPNHHASNLMYSSAGSSSNVNAQHVSFTKVQIDANEFRMNIYIAGKLRGDMVFQMA